MWGEGKSLGICKYVYLLKATFIVYNHFMEPKGAGKSEKFAKGALSIKRLRTTVVEASEGKRQSPIRP